MLFPNRPILLVTLVFIGIASTMDCDGDCVSCDAASLIYDSDDVEAFQITVNKTEIVDGCRQVTVQCRNSADGVCASISLFGVPKGDALANVQLTNTLSFSLTCNQDTKWSIAEQTVTSLFCMADGCI